MFFTALVEPNFKDNLISVGQISKSNNILFNEEVVYLMQKAKAGENAIWGGGSVQINFTLFLIVVTQVYHHFTLSQQH